MKPEALKLIGESGLWRVMTFRIASATLRSVTSDLHEEGFKTSLVHARARNASGERRLA